MTEPNDRMTRLAQIAAAAVESEAKTGVPAELVAAQCVLESAWLTRFSAPNNALGIKMAARHKSGAFVQTTEHMQGEDRRVMAKFASFPALEACFEDHAWILQHVAAYRHAWEAYLDNKSVEGLVRGIAPVYATDPQYAGKILSVMGGTDFKAALAKARQVAAPKGKT